MGEVAVFVTIATEVDILQENVPKCAGQVVVATDSNVIHVKDLVMLLECAHPGVETGVTVVGVVGTLPATVASQTSG